MTNRDEAAAQGPQRLSPRFPRFLLFLSALVIALLFAEALLRLAGFSYLNPYVVDRELGFSLRPNAEGWWRKEGLAYIKINSRGMRDREHPISKPNGTIRIAVLGDSFAEAFQVPIENAFWSVMEKQLQQCAPGRVIEVLNFGVSGFSTGRELILLRQRVWQYNPDMIVLLITTGNDVKDNSRVLSQYSSALPHFVYKNGSLALDDSLLKARRASLVFRLQQSFVGNSFNWLRIHLRLLQLLDSVRDAYLARRERSDRKEPLPDEAGVDGRVFQAPVNADWDDAWIITERLIVQMRDEVRAKGAKFLVVTGSMGIQVTPNQARRAEYMRQLGVTTLFYPDTRIKELGVREGIEVLTLAPVLLEFSSQNQTFVHGFGDMAGTGHWNETGHRIAGRLIAERLCQSGWL